MTPGTTLDRPGRDALAASLTPHGLMVRGGFVPRDDDGLPPLPGGAAPGMLWLVGVVGSSFWPHFTASAEYRDGQPDPLDRWSRRIGESLAQQWGGAALFPFSGPPWLPFQRWADRCEATEKSAMGLRIHPVYGLWHAYRFALALPAPTPRATLPGATMLEAAGPTAPVPGLAIQDICARCDGQPCLHTCPVDGYTVQGFDLNACASHLRTPEGQVCMTDGCRARAACPVGAEYRYSAEHAAFHMAAFLRSH